MKTTETISNHREAVQSFEALQAKRTAADLEHAAELKRIEAEKARTSLIMLPLGHLMQERRLLLERIGNAKSVHADQVAAAGELDAALDALLGSPNENGGRINFGAILNGHRLEPLDAAERAVALFERWFKRNNSKLADLEARMKAYATENNLTYALPVSLGGEAVE